MPELFQVLKCFKCGVFQVHQAKKSNKWECKLCGEKQSIKRHYGLGTGKECRLHVQKLNRIRGEVDENNESNKLNENSADKFPIRVDSNVPHKKDHHSKWSDFVEEKNDAKVLEPDETMYIGNAKVVLEIPSKRRKFNKLKNTSVLSICRETIGESRRLPGPPPVMIHETQEPKTRESKIEIKNSNDYFIEVKDVEQKILEKHEVGKICVPPKVDKNSKWAQYADDSTEDDCEDDLSLQYKDEDSMVNEVTLKNNACNTNTCEKINTLPNNLFSLCDDNDLDDVLDL